MLCESIVRTLSWPADEPLDDARDASRLGDSAASDVGGVTVSVSFTVKTGLGAAPTAALASTSNNNTISQHSPFARML